MLFLDIKLQWPCHSLAVTHGTRFLSMLYLALLWWDPSGMTPPHIVHQSGVTLRELCFLRIPKCSYQYGIPADAYLRNIQRYCFSSVFIPKSLTCLPFIQHTVPYTSGGCCKDEQPCNVSSMAASPSWLLGDCRSVSWKDLQVPPGLLVLLVCLTLLKKVCAVLPPAQRMRSPITKATVSASSG